MELWKPIPGTSGRYEASTLGRIRCWAKRGSFTQRKSQPSINATFRRNTRTNYLRVRIRLDHEQRPKDRLVHRLVLAAFVGPSQPGMHCAHLNGDAADNRIENLAWATPAENQAHRRIHGTSLDGEKHPGAKLTERQVREIRRLHASGAKQRELGARFGVSQREVGRIVNRKVWRQYARETR